MASSSALDFITVKGFKSIASLEKVGLRPINVLIGANGSGKSNFIEVFSFLHAVREGRLQDYVRKAGGAEQLLHFGSKVTEKITIRISFQQEVNQYDLSLKPTEDDSLYASSEWVYFWDKSRGFSSPIGQDLLPRESGREAGISSPNVTRISGWVRLRLGSWRVYHMHDT
ncbi:MAG: AAA family ATPase, partial [Candidatus Binataceae bacterium]